MRKQWCFFVWLQIIIILNPNCRKSQSKKTNTSKKTRNMLTISLLLPDLVLEVSKCILASRGAFSALRLGFLGKDSNREGYPRCLLNFKVKINITAEKLRQEMRAIYEAINFLTLLVRLLFINIARNNSLELLFACQHAGGSKLLSRI